MNNNNNKEEILKEVRQFMLNEGMMGKSFWMSPSGKLYNVNGDHASWVLKNISKFSEGMKKSDFLEMYPKYDNPNTFDREDGNEFLYSIMYEKGWVDVHASMDNLYARKNWGRLTNSQRKSLKNYAIEYKLVVRNPDTDSKIYDPLNESTITESRQELHSWMARNGKIYVVDDSGGNKSHSTFAKKKFGKSLEQMFELGFVRINYVASVLYAHYPKKYGKLSNSQIRTIKSLAVENGMSKVVRDDDEDSKIVWTNENSIECRYKKMLSELSTEEQKLVVDTTKEIMDIIMEDEDVQESSFNLDKVIQEGLLDFQTKHSNKFKHLPRQKKLFRDPSKKRERMSQRDFSVAANYESDRMHLNRVSKQQRKKNVFYNKSKERQNSDTEGMARIAAVERLKQDKSKSEIVGMADFKKIVDAYNIQDIDAIFNGEIKKVGTNGITIQKYGENAFKLVKESSEYYEMNGDEIIKQFKEKSSHLLKTFGYNDISDMLHNKNNDHIAEFLFLYTIKDVHSLINSGKYEQYDKNPKIAKKLARDQSKFINGARNWMKNIFNDNLELRNKYEKMIVDYIMQ